MRFDDIFPIPAVIAVLSIDKPSNKALEELEMLTQAGFAVAVETHPSAQTPESPDTFRALRKKRFLKGMLIEANDYHLQDLAKHFGASFLYVPSIPQGYEQRELVRSWSIHAQKPQPIVLGGRSLPIRHHYHTHISPEAVVLYQHQPFQKISTQELKDAQVQLRRTPTLVECFEPEDAQLIEHTDGLVLRLGENNSWTSELVENYARKIDVVTEQAYERVANEFFR